MIRVTSPNVDLAFYMFTSVKHDIRRKEWKNLLKLYYDSLKENLMILNGNVEYELEFSFEVKSQAIDLI